jgi:hypothetical protein
MCNDPPLRIMHAAAPGLAGGLESVVLDLTTGLRQRGHVVLLAAVLDDGSRSIRPRRAAEAGVDVERIVVLPRLRQEYATSGGVSVASPGLVHARVSGRPARGSRRPPRTRAVVSSVHGFTGGGGRTGSTNGCRSGLRRAQGVVAVSRPLPICSGGAAFAGVSRSSNAWMLKPTLGRRARRALAVSGEVPSWMGWTPEPREGRDVFLRRSRF